MARVLLIHRGSGVRRRGGAAGRHGASAGPVTTVKEKRRFAKTPSLFKSICKKVQQHFRNLKLGF